MCLRFSYLISTLILIDLIETRLILKDQTEFARFPRGITREGTFGDLMALRNELRDMMGFSDPVYGMLSRPRYSAFGKYYIPQQALVAGGGLYGQGLGGGLGGLGIGGLGALSGIGPAIAQPNLGLLG